MPGTWPTSARSRNSHPLICPSIDPQSTPSFTSSRPLPPTRSTRSSPSATCSPAIVSKPLPEKPLIGVTYRKRMADSGRSALLPLSTRSKIAPQAALSLDPDHGIYRDRRGVPAGAERDAILCPRKNPKIQESCKNKAIRRTGAKGQLKNARRNKKRLGFNLPPPSLCFFGFSNGLSIY